MTTTSDTAATFDNEEREERAREIVRTLRIDKGDHFEVAAENSGGTERYGVEYAIAYKMTYTAMGLFAQYIDSLRRSLERAGKLNQFSPEEIERSLAPSIILSFNKVCRMFHDICDAVEEVRRRHCTTDEQVEAVDLNDPTPAVGIHDWLFALHAHLGAITHESRHMIEEGLPEGEREKALAKLERWSVAQGRSAGYRMAGFYLGCADFENTLKHTEVMDMSGLSEADIKAVAWTMISKPQGGPAS